VHVPRMKRKSQNAFNQETCRGCVSICSIQRDSATKKATLAYKNQSINLIGDQRRFIDFIHAGYHATELDIYALLKLNSII
jgi:hypothetical protein